MGRSDGRSAQFPSMSAAVRDTRPQKRRNRRCRASTRAQARPWRPRGVPTPSNLPYERPEIQAADLQEQAIEDVPVSAQVHPAQPPGGVEMRVGTFKPFGAPPPQPLPARAPRIRRRLAYTESRAACLPHQLRRPRAGFDT